MYPLLFDMCSISSSVLADQSPAKFALEAFQVTLMSEL
jgi:hypothetical protein